MSIKKMKETYKIAEKEEAKKFKKSLNKKKSSLSSCISVEVLTDSVYTYLHFLKSLR